MYYAEGTHEPIIDPATFEQAQERLCKIAQQTASRKRPSRSVFSGLIRCGICGNTYKRVTYMGRHLQNLYEQLIDGSTDREAYLSQKQKITAQLQELTEKEAELKAAASVSDADTSPILERYRQYTELDTLTPSIAKELVQRVVVYPDSRLEVQLNCHDELEAMLTGAISSDKTRDQKQSIILEVESDEGGTLYPRCLCKSG